MSNSVGITNESSILRSGKSTLPNYAAAADASRPKKKRRRLIASIVSPIAPHTPPRFLPISPLHAPERKIETRTEVLAVGDICDRRNRSGGAESCGDEKVHKRKEKVSGRVDAGTPGKKTRRKCGVKKKFKIKDKTVRQVNLKRCQRKKSSTPAAAAGSGLTALSVPCITSDQQVQLESTTTKIHGDASSQERQPCRENDEENQKMCESKRQERKGGNESSTSECWKYFSLIDSLRIDDGRPAACYACGRVINPMYVSNLHGHLRICKAHQTQSETGNTKTSISDNDEVSNVTLQKEKGEKHNRGLRKEGNYRKEKKSKKGMIKEDKRKIKKENATGLETKSIRKRKRQTRDTLLDSSPSTENIQAMMITSLSLPLDEKKSTKNKCDNFYTGKEKLTDDLNGRYEAEGHSESKNDYVGRVRQNDEGHPSFIQGYKLLPPDQQPKNKTSASYCWNSFSLIDPNYHRVAEDGCPAVCHDCGALIKSKQMADIYQHLRLCCNPNPNDDLQKEEFLVKRKRAISSSSSLISSASLSSWVYTFFTMRTPPLSDHANHLPPKDKHLSINEYAECNICGTWMKTQHGVESALSSHLELHIRDGDLSLPSVKNYKDLVAGKGSASPSFLAEAAYSSSLCERSPPITYTSFSQKEVCYSKEMEDRSLTVEERVDAFLSEVHSVYANEPCISSKLTKLFIYFFAEKKLNITSSIIQKLTKLLDEKDDIIKSYLTKEKCVTKDHDKKLESKIQSLYISCEFIDWDEEYRSLLEFRNDYGHNRVPLYYRKDLLLGVWAHEQLIQYHRMKDGKQSLLTPYRWKLFNTIGFCDDIEPTYALNGERIKDNEADSTIKYIDAQKQNLQGGEDNMLHGMSVSNDKGESYFTKVQSFPVSDQLLEVKTNEEIRTDCRKDSNIRYQKWCKMFDRLVEYTQKNGHCIPRDIKCHRLRKWCHYQNECHGKKHLKSECFEKLESIGFSFSHYYNTSSEEVTIFFGKDNESKNWKEFYEDLREYKYLYGNLDIPKMYSRKPRLGLWVQEIRRKRDSICKKHLQTLNEMDFIWSRSQFTWDRNVQLLREYKEEFGNTRVIRNSNKPEKYEILKNWVMRLRSEHEKILCGKNSNYLNKYRLNQLEEIGFYFKISEQSWDEKFCALMKYKKRNGHVFVSGKENMGLSKWVWKMKKQITSLTHEQREKLTSAGIMDSVVKIFV